VEIFLVVVPVTWGSMAHQAFNKSPLLDVSDIARLPLKKSYVIVNNFEISRGVLASLIIISAV
jgi:hypothetical protein